MLLCNDLFQLLLTKEIKEFFFIICASFVVFNGCFISGVRITARRSCFLASTVFHEFIFLQEFIVFVMMSNYGVQNQDAIKMKEEK